jgi:hypothetical protein
MRPREFHGPSVYTPLVDKLSRKPARIAITSGSVRLDSSSVSL